MRKKAFQDIKHKIQPLDLLVFRGKDFVSSTIRVVQKKFLGSGDWSHVGLVVTTDLLPIKNGKPGKLYVWESTMSGRLTDGVYDTESGKAKFGVQIRDLEELLAASCEIGWCRLRVNPWKEKKLMVQEFYKKHGKATYEYNIFPLFKTIFSCMSKVKGSKDKFFCSELVATIYVLVGVIEDVDPETIAPVELLNKKLVKKPVLLLY
jgi:hypothetical protein